MSSRILPPCVDNVYGGHKLALWLAGVVLFTKAAQSLVSMFNGYTVARGPDGIPLDTYSTAAAQTVVSLFALLGFSYVLICFVGLLVLIRYRSLVPLVFALLAADFLCRRLILHFLPIIRTGTPVGLYMNVAIFALMIIGLALSLRRQAPEQASAAVVP